MERPVFKDRIVEKPVVKKLDAFRLASISFAYASTKPAKKQDIVFENIVNYLKQNPSARIRLDGYADKATGSASWNQKLSEKRAQAVYDALIKEGVDKDQLELVGFGGTANMFGKNYLNRVVILE